MQTTEAQLTATPTQQHLQTQLPLKRVKLEPISPIKTEQKTADQHETVVQYEINSQNLVGIDDKEGNNSSLNNNSDTVDENGKISSKQLILTRKETSVRAKERRILQNRRLRKIIIPKNALMALNEIEGITIGEFTIMKIPTGGFSAFLTVNGHQYDGRGNSQTAAKSSACEKALRYYVIAKMRQEQQSIKRTGSMITNFSLCNEPTDANDRNESNEKVDDHNTELDPIDDVPMINLACFALYKLYAEWESEGFVIPDMHRNTSDNERSIVVKEPKTITIRNELPVNWESMHPASLLCMMRPGTTYTEKGKVGEHPNVIQSMAVVVDNQEYVAVGRSKKVARRNVAAVACNTLFGTNFVKEELVEL